MYESSDQIKSFDSARVNGLAPIQQKLHTPYGHKRLKKRQDYSRPSMMKSREFLDIVNDIIAE